MTYKPQPEEAPELVSESLTFIFSGGACPQTPLVLNLNLKSGCTPAYNTIAIGVTVESAYIQGVVLFRNTTLTDQSD